MKKKVKKTAYVTSDNKAGVPTSAKVLIQNSKQTKPGKRVSILLCSATIVAFLLLWTRALNPKVEDPWNKAVRLLTTANQLSDTVERLRLVTEAGSLLKRITSDHSYHARVWLFYGYYFIEKQMWDSAIICEKKAIELGKGGVVNQVEYQASDGLCYALSMRLKDVQAKTAFETARLLKNAEVKGFDSPCLIKMQGSLYTDLNKPDSALLYLSKVASIKPDADIYFNMALNYGRKQELNNAVEALHKALAIDKEHAGAKRMLQEITTAPK
jgi:tetratricopeptide (TPR) repeat protein